MVSYGRVVEWDVMNNVGHAGCQVTYPCHSSCGRLLGSKAQVLAACSRALSTRGLGATHDVLKYSCLIKLMVRSNKERRTARSPDPWVVPRAASTHLPGLGRMIHRGTHGVQVLLERGA